MNIETDFSPSPKKGNPFRSPNRAGTVEPNQLNGLLWRAVLTIVGAMVSVAILGGFCGFLVGVFAPGYYVAMFPNAAELPGFNPRQLGIGLGAVQGAGVGILAGCVSVASVAWYRSRITKHYKTDVETN